MTNAKVYQGFHDYKKVEEHWCSLSISSQNFLNIQFLNLFFRRWSTGSSLYNVTLFLAISMIFLLSSCNSV